MKRMTFYEGNYRAVRDQFCRVTRKPTLDTPTLFTPERMLGTAERDGWFVAAIRRGNAVTITRLHRCSPEVQALVTAACGDAESFTHPVTGEVIPIHPRFHVYAANVGGTPSPAKWVKAIAKVERLPQCTATDRLICRSVIMNGKK